MQILAYYKSSMYLQVTKSKRTTNDGDSAGTVNDGECGTLMEIGIGKANSRKDTRVNHTLVLHIGISIQNMPKQTEGTCLTRCECKFILND